MAFMVGMIISVIIKIALIATLALGGAYALTTYVDLPSLVDMLIWILAGGYALFCGVVALTACALAVKASREF